jgi:hypothetical protein
MEPELRAVLRRPFDEQVAAFRLRLRELRPTATWDQYAGDGHDRAFMVAGATKADLLADLAGAVDRAIAEGTTLEDFRRDFRSIVERRGWHGWTGEGTARGEAWRTRVIYRTNIATSYAAGRRAQLIEAGFPFWVYRHGGSADPRPHHLAWDGLVLEADHPFWATHSPPNGWGCSCRVFGARSRAAARRLGGDPDKALPDSWRTPSPKTGAPKGIDRGWDHAPGATVAETVRAMTRQTVSWPHELAKAYLDGLPPSTADALGEAVRRSDASRDAIRRYAERALGERGGAPIASDVLVERFRTMGLVPSAQRDRIGALAGRDVTGYDFAIDASAVRHVMRRHGPGTNQAAQGQAEVAPADFAMIPLVLDAPDEIVSGGTSIVGLPLLEYRKRIGARTYYVTMEVRSPKRRMLALATMWVR